MSCPNCTSVPCQFHSPYRYTVVPHSVPQFYPQPTLVPVERDRIVMMRLIPDGVGGYTEVERVEVMR